MKSAKISNLKGPEDKHTQKGYRLQEKKPVRCSKTLRLKLENAGCYQKMNMINIKYLPKISCEMLMVELILYHKRKHSLCHINHQYGTFSLHNMNEKWVGNNKEK